MSASAGLPWTTIYEFASDRYPPFRRSAAIAVKLTARIEMLASQHPNWNDSDYCQYFISVLRNAAPDSPRQQYECRYAHLHLVAGFDLARCQLVQRIADRAPGRDRRLRFELYFGLTNLFLHNREELLTAIDNYRAPSFELVQLRAYIIGILNNKIREASRLRSDWNLLVKTSERIHREALKASYSEADPIEQYLFAWKCFAEVYKHRYLHDPNRDRSQPYPEPANEDFARAARTYNRDRAQLGLPLPLASSPEITPQLLREWMQQICLSALRNYQPKEEVMPDIDLENTIASVAIDASDTPELEDSQSAANTWLSQLDERFQAELAAIAKTLADPALKSRILPAYRPAIMPLGYRHSLRIFPLKQLAGAIGVTQPTLSRFINKYYEQPLLQVVEQHLGTSLEEQTQQWVDRFLASRLKVEPSDPMAFILARALVDRNQETRILDDREQVAVKMAGGSQRDRSEIARTLQVEEREIEVILDSALEKLARSLQTAVKAGITSWLRAYFSEEIARELRRGFNEQLTPTEREIAISLYCRKRTEAQLLRDRPQLPVGELAASARAKLEQHLIGWSQTKFGIDLSNYRKNLTSAIEIWADRLHLIELTSEGE